MVQLYVIKFTKKPNNPHAHSPQYRQKSQTEGGGSPSDIETAQRFDKLGRDELIFREKDIERYWWIKAVPVEE